MRKIYQLLLFVATIFIVSCSSEKSLESFDNSRGEDGILSDSFGSGLDPSSGESGSGGVSGGQENQTGLITAGEWNDLDNWPFWKDLINGQEYADKPGYWHFHNYNRVAVQVNINSGQPLINAKLQLYKNETLEWEARTDNKGKAELWIDLFQKNRAVNINEYKLTVNGQPIINALKLYDEGINELKLDINQNSPDRVELAFIVDATGSMSDELEFLKDDLQDVIEKVQQDNRQLEILTSSIFYRDEGDQYVVRKSEFSADLNKTVKFINDQSANGGGDFPEAVHTALKSAISELQWSENTKTKLAFLLLDAPPHYDLSVIEDLQSSIKEAAKKGIKIIPITASGIDKETEFLMRFFSITTNGTYTFITNHSGIGNDHIEPSIGQYEVEFLNDLLVRLIKQYTE